MPAYVIADVTVTDAATMDEYRKRTSLVMVEGVR